MYLLLLSTKVLAIAKKKYYSTSKLYVFDVEPCLVRPKIPPERMLKSLNTL